MSATTPVIISKNIGKKNNKESKIEIATKEKKAENEEFDAEVEIHSKNFEDAESCKNAVKLVNSAIEGEVVDDFETNEYSTVKIRKKPREKTNGKYAGRKLRKKPKRKPKGK